MLGDLLCSCDVNALSVRSLPVSWHPLLPLERFGQVLASQEAGLLALGGGGDTHHLRHLP